MEPRPRAHTVKIEVRLFANLADYLPRPARGAAAIVDLPEGASVAELVERLALPAELPRLLLVNGREVTLDHSLDAGDVVSIFPPLAGG